MRTIAAASLAALLTTALAAPADAASKTAAAKAPAGKPLIAISQIALADTSGEKPDTAGTIWTRIKALTNQIGTGLTGSGLYDIKVVPKANCEDYSETCLGKWAKDTGGNLIMIGTVLKDNADDGKKLRHYFDVVVKQRAQRQPEWKSVLEARRELDR